MPIKPFRVREVCLCLHFCNKKKIDRNWSLNATCICQLSIPSSGQQRKTFTYVQSAWNQKMMLGALLIRSVACVRRVAQAMDLVYFLRQFVAVPQFVAGYDRSHARNCEFVLSQNFDWVIFGFDLTQYRQDACERGNWHVNNAFARTFRSFLFSVLSCCICAWCGIKHIREVSQYHITHIGCQTTDSP